MNSNRILRAVVTGLTIVAVLWLIHLLSTKRTAQANMVRAKSAAAPASLPRMLPRGEVRYSQTDSPTPPTEVGKTDHPLPFAALDDNCLGGVVTDLSGCTRFLSGGRAKLYTIHVKEGQNLRIRVEPLWVETDVSFALFHDQLCMVGRDAAAKGDPERCALANLPEGDYKLWVGGYDEDCGPYMLTIDDQPPPPPQVQDVSSYSGRNGTILRWASFAEVEVRQFQLYRVRDGSRERIAVLRAHGSPAGFGRYRYMDRKAHTGNGYELEMVMSDGRSEVFSVQGQGQG